MLTERQNALSRHNRECTFAGLCLREKTINSDDENTTFSIIKHAEEHRIFFKNWYLSSFLYIRGKGNVGRRKTIKSQPAYRDTL